MTATPTSEDPTQSFPPPTNAWAPLGASYENAGNKTTTHSIYCLPDTILSAVYILIYVTLTITTQFRYLLFPSDEKPEAQTGLAICPRSHSQ